MTLESKAFERHGPEILAFLRRRLWDREEAEDLCQETFVRALRAKDNLRDRTKLRAYLLRIANNLLINHIRRRAVVTSESNLGRDDLVENVSLQTYSDPQQASPDVAVEWSELTHKLHALLEQLPPEQRVAFELGVLQRRPYAEIARLQSWSLAKVKINVYRARKLLMAGLREYRPARAASAGKDTS
jgi:RNA polymerase sigma-70 factor (ECF subfamily)